MPTRRARQPSFQHALSDFACTNIAHLKIQYKWAKQSYLSLVRTLPGDKNGKRQINYDIFASINSIITFVNILKELY